MHFDPSVQLSHKNDTKYGNENHAVTKHKASTEEIEHTTLHSKRKKVVTYTYYILHTKFKDVNTYANNNHVQRSNT